VVEHYLVLVEVAVSQDVAASIKSVVINPS